MTLAIGTVTELKLESELVSEFYAANWPRKIALSNKHFYDWQFRSVPSAQGIDNCVVAYDASERKIAGVMGVNARLFSLGQVWKMGGELTTWIVNDKYRATGVGAKILAHIQNAYELLIGMGISESALPVYMRSGFRYLGAIPRFVKVFNFDAVATISEHAPLARKLFKQWAHAQKVTAYLVSEGLGEWVDPVFQRSRKEFDLFTRDYKHLVWRFAQHPFFTYKVFNVLPADGSGSALVCLREETGVVGLRLIHIIDCFGDDNAIPAALSFIESYCMENQFDAADFYSTSSKLNRFFLCSGWFSSLDDKFFQFPHLFHPIEIRKPPTTSLIYWSKENFSGFCDFSRVYVTKQDADLDRPIPST